MAGRSPAIDADLRDLLAELVAIDSVNPTLVPGGAGEKRIARHIAEWLRARGFEVELQNTGQPGRPNAIGVLRGTGGGRSLMLNGHAGGTGRSMQPAMSTRSASRGWTIRTGRGSQTGASTGAARWT